ncbi:MAG: hypothetical protein AAF645_30205, partial [Myxococcota bacterium]
RIVFSSCFGWVFSPVDHSGAPRGAPILIKSEGADLAGGADSEAGVARTAPAKLTRVVCYWPC